MFYAIRQRPIAVKTSGIGVWEDVLQIMSVFGIHYPYILTKMYYVIIILFYIAILPVFTGVLTNCAIMGITSKKIMTLVLCCVSVCLFLCVLFFLLRFLFYFYFYFLFKFIILLFIIIIIIYLILR